MHCMAKRIQTSFLISDFSAPAAVASMHTKLHIEQQQNKMGHSVEGYKAPQDWAVEYWDRGRLR